MAHVLQVHVKALISAIFLMCFIFCGGALAQVRQPTPVELALIYYKLTNLFIPWDDLAAAFDDYRQARDEFQRREIGARIKQNLEAQYGQLSKEQLFLFRTSVNLGEYDFQKNVFPTSFPAYMYNSVRSDIRGPSLALVFLNAQSVNVWPIDIERARAISSKLGRSRQLTAEIEYRVLRGREDEINYTKHRILDVNVERIRFLSQGEVLGILEPTP